MSSYLGIDPGKTGAWALLDERGYYKYSGLCPDNVVAMAQVLKGYDLDQQMEGPIHLVGLEAVHAMPGQGVTSMFTFGTNFGQWQGILAALGLPFELITPQRWQKAVLDSSRDAMAYARRRWPEAPLARKKDDGVADALCLAEYVRCKHQGGGT